MAMSSVWLTLMMAVMRLVMGHDVISGDARSEISWQFHTNELKSILSVFYDSIKEWVYTELYDVTGTPRYLTKLFIPPKLRKIKGGGITGENCVYTLNIIENVLTFSKLFGIKKNNVLHARNKIFLVISIRLLHTFNMSILLMSILEWDIRFLMCLHILPMKQVQSRDISEFPKWRTSLHCRHHCAQSKYGLIVKERTIYPDIL